MSVITSIETRLRRGEIATTTARQPSGSRGHLVATACLGAALVLWVASLPRIDPAGLDDLGLISILPWTVWASLGLLAAGFALSLRGDLASGRLPALHLVGLVLVLHATPAIAYGTLRYSWAWKHIGVVDFIQRHGALDPAAPFLAAYHNWPGFFVVSALLADLFGLKPIDLADLVRFAPTVFNLLFLAALPPLLRQFTTDRRLIWTAMWIFAAGNWIGQDYFSPQATAYVLYLVMLGLCLGPLGVRQPPADAAAGRVRRLIASLRAFISRGLPQLAAPVDAARRGLAAATVLLIIVAIAAIHQFTPLVVISALFGLAVIGRLSIGIFLFAVVAEVLWLLYFAETFVAMQLPAVVADFGRTADDVLNRLVDTSVVSRGQAWISIASRGLTAGIAAAALVGGLRRLAAGHWDGPAVVLALAPVSVLAATSYGGEIIFRIYFFGLPFFAYFAAAQFFPTASHGRSWTTSVLAAVFGLVLVFGFVLANNGKDRQYTFTPNEVSAARWLYESAPPSSILVEGATSYPSLFINYENFTYLPIANEDAATRAEVLGDPVGVLARWLDDPQWQANFVIITRSQINYVDDMGIMPRGALRRIEKALLASPRFKLVYANRDASIFTLNPATSGMGRWAR